MAKTEQGEGHAQGAMNAVSNAMVSLHKEQFGRGPTRAVCNFAGENALVCVLEDVLLPAERAMVAMGGQDRVRDQRTYMQVATARQFISTVEAIVYRKVRGFSSATDPDANLVFEIFAFEPLIPNDGHGAIEPRLSREGTSARS